jgi:hypothetical protein
MSYAEKSFSIMQRGRGHLKDRIKRRRGRHCTVEARVLQRAYIFYRCAFPRVFMFLAYQLYLR